MGAAPSAELLKTAPFRPPRGGTRQIALIPFSPQFFPSPYSPLFMQLYDARMDPSVRYYLRYRGEDLCKDRIPPIAHTKEELYAIYINASRPPYATNAALAEGYAIGGARRIRPIPCAVVFLYDGANHVPEGSVRLVGPGDVHVKVIGAIGHINADYRHLATPLADEEETLHVQMYITKSAGDHNMARVMLLAAYIFHHQCLRVIGLPTLPTLPTTFMSFKTNIPFLCFLRELRDRTGGLLEDPESPCMWLDDLCIRGLVPAAYVRSMCTAFAQHYVEFIEAKSQQKALKQLQSHQLRAPQPSYFPHFLEDTGELLSAHSLAAGRRDALGSPIHSLTGCLSSTDLQAPSPQNALHTLISGSRRTTKVGFTISGYVTSPRVTIPAWSSVPDEVYIVCVDSTVRVVAENVPLGCLSSCPSADPGGSRPASTTFWAPLEEEQDRLTTVATFAVRRGDILAFREDHSAIGAERGGDASQHADGDEGKGTSAPLNWSIPGRWVADPTVHLENVLLSLVRDECKSAREADMDDPRWVRDAETQCPVHDGSFYIWRFVRGEEVFFYGTVPKFANPNKRKSSVGGRFDSSVTNASSSGATQILSSDYISGAHRLLAPNASVTDASSSQTLLSGHVSALASLTENFLGDSLRDAHAGGVLNRPPPPKNGIHVPMPLSSPPLLSAVRTASPPPPYDAVQVLPPVGPRGSTALKLSGEPAPPEVPGGPGPQPENVSLRARWPPSTFYGTALPPTTYLPTTGYSAGGSTNGFAYVLDPSGQLNLARVTMPPAHPQTTFSSMAHPPTPGIQWVTKNPFCEVHMPATSVPFPGVTPAPQSSQLMTTTGPDGQTIYLMAAGQSGSSANGRNPVNPTPMQRSTIFAADHAPPALPVTSAGVLPCTGGVTPAESPSILRQPMMNTTYPLQQVLYPVTPPPLPPFFALGGQ